MQLVNMSSRAFINFFGLNFPCLLEDKDGDLSYEHVLVPFVGCDESDFTEFNGITKLLAQVEPKITGTTLVLRKKTSLDDNYVLFLYSFPVMHGGEFGTFPEATNPEVVYKFFSGNPESGYFYEMLFVLQKDVRYEILYHSEPLNKIIKFVLFCNSDEEFVSVTSSVVM